LPVPDQRDPGLTRTLLASWIAGRVGVPDATVSMPRTPAGSGFSSETLLFDAEWTAGGRVHREALVARVAPTAHQVFPDPRFDEQHRVLRILAERTDVPVPAVRWHEPDAAILGAPFIVMRHVEGVVPPDSPPYHQEGWVTEAAPALRARMWWSALDVLARVHRLDADALGLDFLDQPEYGATGIDQQLGYYERFLPWACRLRVPVAEAALAWLRAHQPDEPEPPGLLWGDSRIGNVIFRDGEAQVALDWEMASLGQPEMDLAWFLYLDRHHCEGVDAPRLEGFPSPQETIARYEQLLGRPMRSLEYYEVFAGLRFAVIMARISQMFIDYGMLPPDSDYPVTNTAARLLQKLLPEDADALAAG
jgi:aminoglycoside phosphotransferase (APT) family kinase protein